MPRCEICGGRFTEQRCFFCGRSVCSSCILVESNRCRQCQGRGGILLTRFVRRNLILIIFLGTMWIYTVYPFPFVFALGV